MRGGERRQAPMKRRLAKVLVLLALGAPIAGAVVNVLVSWGCASWADPWNDEVLIHGYPDDEGRSGAVFVEAGWPRRCMTGVWYGRAGYGDYAFKPPRWLAPRQPGVPRAIPLRPMWSPFIFNTAIYAGTLYLLVAPLAVRRVIRRQRGRCVKCGYDLRHAEHELCPECGTLTPNPSPGGRGESNSPGRPSHQ